MFVFHLAVAVLLGLVAAGVSGAKQNTVRVQILSKVRELFGGRVEGVVDDGWTQESIIRKHYKTCSSNLSDF